VRRWDGSSWEEVGAGSASGGGISDNSGWSGAPSVTITPGGMPYVAWSDYSYGDAEIYVRRRPLPDLSIVSVVPLQALEGRDLVVGKATAVKVVVRSDGAAAVRDVPVTLTYDGREISTFCVAEERNIGADFGLLDDNTERALSFSDTATTKTIYFFDPDLTPTSSGTYQVSVEVQCGYDAYPSDNSATSAPVDVRRTNLSGTADGSVELAFLSIDGAAATSYMGAHGTEQFAAMFPVRESLVSDRYIGSLGSDATGRFGFSDFYFNFLFPVYDAMKLASPTSSRYVAVLPPGWFGDYHPAANNVAGQWFPLVPRMVLVEADWQSPQKMLRELGHSFGLHTLSEECDLYPDGVQVTNGLDVERRRLMQHGVKNRYGLTASVYSIMGEDRPSAYPWIKPADYDWLILQHTENDTSELLLVSGVVSRNGEVNLADWWRLPSGLADPPTPGDYAIEMRDGDGNLLYTHGFSPTFVTAGGASVDSQPFAFAIPYPVGTSDIHIVRNGSLLASRHVTPNSPQVSIVSPSSGSVFAIKDAISITWNGYDADGDTLSYAVLYSSDNGASWQTLDIGLGTASYQMPAAALTLGTCGRIKVIATDGVNTGQAVSGGAFSIEALVYLPVMLRNYGSAVQPSPPVNNPPNAPSNPSPPDGAANQSVNVMLSWTGGDPDGDSVTYEVYFETGDSTPDVLICDDVTSGSCSPGTLSNGTHYYWRVVATDEHGGVAGGPVWDFSTGSSFNNSPNMPSSPSPAGGATNQGLDVGLGWTGGDPDGDSVTYDVYFEANDSTPDVLVSDDQSSTTYDPGTLNPGTHYYWRIVATDEHGAATTGPVWDFSTGSSSNNSPNMPSSPSPASGATNQGLNVGLGWTGGDPDGDSVTYDVYFEANDSTPDVLVSDDQSGTTYDPGILSPDTRYYWRIVATDEHGAATTGPVWDFLTESPPPAVGPIVYESHTIDDDTSGNSNGNGDGIINPGETIELWVSLANLGAETATSVGVVLTTDDPYVSGFLYNDSSDYPDIAGGETKQNSNDWDFVVDPATPDMHVITFYLNPITASNGGPWTDNFTVVVEDPSLSPPYTPAVPGPPDGATMASVATQLVWTGGDPDTVDTVTYDVYVGTSDPPTTLVCDDVSVEACAPGSLAYSTDYHWYVVATDSTGRSTIGPVWRFRTASDGLLPVAVFDYSGRPSYFSGNNVNQWLTYFSILDGDPEGRFQVGVIADLSAATLASFERLVLPDNGVPDVYLSDVAAWFTSGRRIVAVDSAVCYAAYSGFMWPASAGSNGRDVYWDYSSSSNDQEVVRLNKATEDYAVGDVLTSKNNDTQMYTALLPEGTLALTAKATNHSRTYVAERWVADQGSIIVLGPYAPVQNDAYPLVRDAVEGAVSPLVYYDHTIDDNTSGNSNGNGDGVVNPGETIELWVSLANLGAETATSVGVVLTTDDPYVSDFLYNDSSDYPDIPGGGTRQNSDDWDFAVDSATPDGHVITFYLNPITAGSGGPWTDSFNIVVSAP